MFILNAENRSLFVNASFLALMQAANMFLPLLTVPFLVRVLGIELFGQLAFVTAFMYYFVVLSDYGFNLTATRDISVNRHDIEEVSRIYSQVTVIKLALLILSFLLMLAIVFFVPTFFEHWPLYLASFMVVICQALFPTWFFQGMEAMKYITYLSVFAKVFFMLGNFYFVFCPENLPFM